MVRSRKAGKSAPKGAHSGPWPRVSVSLMPKTHDRLETYRRALSSIPGRREKSKSELINELVEGGLDHAGWPKLPNPS